MGEEGEKTCPLCAEEMDLTDQQLKPCKCGYEICVWCWHHIMDMAEKDSTEGRCPACRTPYDKERIVGTTVNCERLVSEINSERRLKSQKAKPKASDGRKHLGSQRVIQRNLVYINGIPAGLADEDALQRKEYFGQYGKVLKVSISRTAGGAIQYSPNNTCSVYITYSKEEEAVRCIQSVHGFVLEDKSLRACFGTTKYCHAWLRNMPCNNPECLYLHEVGIQEDSFDKDEIVSAFARSKAQQNAGATNNLQLRRSGNVLPPPADDFASSSTSSSEKLIIRTVPNTTPSHVRGSPPNSGTGKSAALPAAASWGLRGSNGRSLIASSSCSDGPGKQNHDTPLVTDAAKKPIANEVTHAAHLNGKQVLLDLSKKSIVKDSQSTAHDTHEEAVQDSYPSTWPSISKSNSSSISAVPNAAKSVELGKELSIGASDHGGNVAADKSQNLCARLSSINIGNDSPRVDTNDIGSNASVYSQLSLDPPGFQDLQHHQQLYNEHVRKPSVSEASSSHTSRETVRSEGWVSDSQRQILPGAQIDRQEDVHEFDGRSLNALESNGNSRYNSSMFLGSYGQSWQVNDTFSAVEHGYRDPITARSEVDETLLRSTESESNGYYGNTSNSAEDMTKSYERSDLSYLETDKETGNFGYGTSNAAKSTVDWGESSIISNILAMDFDTWDTSLASPQNLAKILSQSDKEHKIPNAWRAQNNNQSRFSFARQDDYGMQGPDSEPSSSNSVHADRYTAAKLDSVTNGDLYMDKRWNGSLSSIIEDPYNFSRGISNMPNDKLSVSRGQISAPPGFSVPSRAPPPGFSHERMDQPFDAISGSRVLENSAMLRNQYQSHSTGNLGTVEDVEFIDPAIITARQGMLPNGIHNSGLDVKSTFAPQLSASENDLRLQLLMQQSFSANQNLMFSNHIRDRFPPMGDAYNSIPSMHLEQSPFVQSSLQSRNGPISNGNGWNEIQNGNDIGMAELLRNERLGYNNYFSGYEDLKYQIPSSGDLYSRAFGM